jgi:hypothetical protein
VQANAATLADHIEEISPGGLFDLDDPKVGVEFHFARETGFDRGIRGGLHFKACGECAVGAPPGSDRGLRRRPEQIRRAVKPADAHKDGASFLGAAAAHDGIGALDLTAAQISGDP